MLIPSLEEIFLPIARRGFGRWVNTNRHPVGPTVESLFVDTLSWGCKDLGNLTAGENQLSSIREGRNPISPKLSLRKSQITVKSMAFYA